MVRPSTNASSIYRRLSQFLWLHFKHLQFASFFFTLRTVAYTQYANQAFIAYFAAHLHSAHPHITTHIHTLLSKSWQFAVSLHTFKKHTFFTSSWYIPRIPSAAHDDWSDLYTTFTLSSICRASKFVGLWWLSSPSCYGLIPLKEPGRMPSACGLPFSYWPGSAIFMQLSSSR